MFYRSSLLLPLLQLGAIVVGLLASDVQAQTIQQSYSAWTYDEANQRYTCAYNVKVPNQPAQQQTVVYLPSRPDYFFYYDPAQGTYWIRCATMHHPSTKPSQTQWSRFVNNQWTELSADVVTVPMVRNGPAITPPELPAGTYNPNTPLDLGPAIEETRQVFADQGLPFNWYHSLQRGNAPGTLEGEYPLYLTGIWEMVEPEVTRRFCRRFQTRRSPTSEIFNGAIGSNNAAYEEMLLLTLIGEDHQHLQHSVVRVPRYFELPNLDPKFLQRDGAVNFVAIRDAYVGHFRQDATLGVNESESTANNREEMCRVYGNWHIPTGSPPGWAKQQLASRVEIRVEFVEGTRTAPRMEVWGNRRLAVGSYIQIGYRKNSSQDYSPIFLAGPYHEQNYQPVGPAQVGVGAWSMAWRVGDCNQDFFYRDLDSLNIDLTPQEAQQAAARIQAEKIPVAERPSLVSVGDNPRADITNLHRKLHEILSPGKDPVPAFPDPAPAPTPTP